MFRNIILKMEEPLMKLVAHQDFRFFTLLDLLEVLNATLANMSDKTCNRFLSGLNEGRHFVDEKYLNSSRSPDQITNDIIDLARIIAGTSWCVLQDVSPDQLDRLMRMSGPVKSFLVSLSFSFRFLKIFSSDEMGSNTGIRKIFLAQPGQRLSLLLKLSQRVRIRFHFKAHKIVS
jgi:hypothetical protein